MAHGWATEGHHAKLITVEGIAESPLRLAILDDHNLVTLSIAALLERDAPDVLVVWQGGSAAELCAALDRGLAVDLVLLDVLLGEQNPLAAAVAEELTTRGVACLLVTMKPGGPQVRAALLAGAADIVQKDASEAELLEAIRRAGAGEALWSRRALAIIGEAVGPQLSDRETEAVRLYVQGMLIGTIARQMGVSENTCNTYLKRARAKFQAAGRPVASREQLRLAVEDSGIFPTSGP